MLCIRLIQSYNSFNYIWCKSCKSNLIYALNLSKSIKIYWNQILMSQAPDQSTSQITSFLSASRRREALWNVL